MHLRQIIDMPISVAKEFTQSLENIVPLGNGYINDTYLVATPTKPFVLQRINKHVFTNPEQIMANLKLLNQHIGMLGNIQIGLTIPQLLTAANGKNYVCDDNGDYWRALSYIENSESLESINKPKQAGQVGCALGQFHRLTYKLESTKLYDTLPGFHITPDYLHHYQQVKHSTKLPENSYCADFISKYQPISNDLETAKAQGLLIERVIHGDPKLNNFLFDKDSQRIVSVVDLDTVKPGLIHYDIGDCLRSCCHNLETDGFNLDLCQIILSNYLNEMRELFTDSDYRFLYPCIRLIPFELGLRFYSDYLEGNLYFKVTQPEDNLRRAIGQFNLCANVIAQETEIENIINQLKSQ